MIARITQVAVAVTILALLPLTTQAQMGPPPATGIVGGGGECGTADCADCGDPSCTDQWISTRRFGLQHNANCACPRCRPRHAWASFDALMWWGKGRATPALVTSGADGVLPDAPILSGDGSVGNGLAAGARADFGFWFDECETLGMGAKVWGLAGDSDGFSAASPDGSTVLARPFYNVVLDQEDALLISSPGLLAGSVNTNTSSDVLAAEAYLRSGILAGRGYNVDLVGGYHFLRFDNDLSVFSSSTVIDPGGAAPIGTLINVLDEFDARNEFHGGTLGLVAEARHGCWTLSGLAKFSVGNMRQTVGIDGYQSITTPDNLATVSPGGLLAQPTNMGEYARDVTAWIPEFGVTAGYDVRDWLRLTMGYNVLWISNVAFAGDQIDRNVNPTQFGGNPLIGPARPAFAFQENEYWLHGLTLGATLMY
ncbi:MAG: BBP7 family outer membrane beta-barrel protein [Pirellulaceae bacterium]